MYPAINKCVVLASHVISIGKTQGGEMLLKKATTGEEGWMEGLC